ARAPREDFQDSTGPFPSSARAPDFHLPLLETLPRGRVRAKCRMTRLLTASPRHYRSLGPELSRPPALQCHRETSSSDVSRFAESSRTAAWVSWRRPRTES